MEKEACWGKNLPSQENGSVRPSDLGNFFAAASAVFFFSCRCQSCQNHGNTKVQEARKADGQLFISSFFPREPSP